MVLNPKAQSWSLDATIAVVIFMGAIVVFYSYLNNQTDTKHRLLSGQATMISRLLTADDSSIRVVKNGSIDDEKLMELRGIEYKQLKGQLKISSDFCIYLEDGDGNIVLINNLHKGIGSDKINLSNAPCNA